jgi:hypothetical protein
MRSSLSTRPAPDNDANGKDDRRDDEQRICLEGRMVEQPTTSGFVMPTG